MIVLFPKLPNGNILWKCEYCGQEYEVCSSTRRVWLYCICGKFSPKCNREYYTKGGYLKKK